MRKIVFAFYLILFYETINLTVGLTPIYVKFGDAQYTSSKFDLTNSDFYVLASL